jgi:tetratricopeptide (TPR) repeat protein
MDDIVDLSKKEQIIELLLKLDPSNKLFLLKKIYLLERKGDTKKLVEVFLEFVDLNPVANVDFVCDEAKKLAEELTVKELIKIAQFFEIADRSDKLNMFIVHLENEEADNIVDFFDKFTPSHLFFSSLEKVIKKYEEKRTKDSLNYNVHYVLGFLCFIVERYEEAIAAFQFVIRSEHYIPLMCLFLGMSFEKIGLFDFAAKQYEKGLSLKDLTGRGSSFFCSRRWKGDTNGRRRQSMISSRKNDKVGKILVDKKFITEEELKQALKIQKVTHEPLLKILIDTGCITDEQAAQTLGIQWGMEYVDVLNYPVDKEALHTLDPNRARYYGIFLLKKEGGKFHVAISDPTNIEAMDYVRLTLGENIIFHVTTRANVEQAIEKHYEMEDALKKAEEEAFPSATILKEGDEFDISKLREMGEEAPIVRIVNSIITEAILQGASDIHIEPLEAILRTRYRIDGILYEHQSLPKKIQPGVTSRVKILSNMDIAERRLPQDGRISLKFEGRRIDFRVSSLPTVHGEKIVLRILDATSALMPLEKLGFSAENFRKFEDAIAQPYGMVLISGPTGSGKTTTLYSALSRLNATARNIVTVEDPVEYRLKGINQVQVNLKAHYIDR